MKEKYLVSIRYTWMFFVWSPPPHVTPSISAAQFTPRLAPEPSAGSVIYLVSSLSSGAALINTPDLTLHAGTRLQLSSSPPLPLTTVGVEVETQTRGIEEQASLIPRVTSTQLALSKNIWKTR